MDDTQQVAMLKQLLAEARDALAADFGSDVPSVKGAITKNRNTNEHDPAEHLAWLKRQKDTLEENIAAKKSPFKPPAGVVA